MGIKISEDGTIISTHKEVIYKGADDYDALYEKTANLFEAGDWETAYNQLLEGDNKGDSNSTCILGDIYFYGIGITQDTERGIDLYIKALNMGNPRRAYDLGSIFERGKEGVAEDDYKAFHYYSKGSELGDPESMGSMAYCYMQGRGTDEDFEKALFYGLQAAKSGDYDGMLTLAVCYNDGLGTAPDPYVAAHWYRELIRIEPEDDYAMFRLAICLADPFVYFNIIPTREMLKEAFEWASKAVELGHIGAHLIIAWFYEKGDIVRQDFDVSHKFLKIAADNGDETAQNLLKRYRKNIYGHLYIP